MESVIKSIPTWFLVGLLLYVAVLVSYAVYDNRKIDFWPPAIYPGPPEPPGPDPTPQPSAGEKGVSAVKIYTGTPEGTFYKLGKTLAEAINRQNKTDDSLPIYLIDVPTDGSMENCIKIREHTNDKMSESIATLAMLQIPVGSLSRHDCVGELALVAPLYPDPLYLAVRDYESIIQGAGRPDASMDARQVCRTLHSVKSIYVGKPRSGTRLMADSILKTCRIPSAITRVEDLSYEQAVTRLTKSEPCDVDAAFFQLPSNSDLINTLDSSSNGVCFVPVPLRDLGDLDGLFRDAKDSVLAGSYPKDLGKYAVKEPKRHVCGKTRKEVYESIFSWALLVTTKDAPKSIVKTAMDTIYEHSSENHWEDYQLFRYPEAQSIMQKLLDWRAIAIHGAAKEYYVLP